MPRAISPSGRQVRGQLMAVRLDQVADLEQDVGLLRE
jgi:hypothetical protein